MMDCAHYRRSLLADPRDANAGLRSHRVSCHDCGRYTEQLLRFESRLGRALRLNVEASVDEGAAPLAEPSLRREAPRAAGRRRTRRRWLAAAASVLLAVTVAGSLWIAIPDRSLAADVVGHMANEPNAWARTGLPVPPPRLNQVLSESHVRLKPNAGLVSYANSCLFRGHIVPHLVVQTDAGPVTVMVLAHESLRRTVQFDEQGYRGIILPVRGHGSLAVLERGPDTDMSAVNGVAERVLGAMDWT